jgi:hypothetical protein
VEGQGGSWSASNAYPLPVTPDLSAPAQAGNPGAGCSWVSHKDTKPRRGRRDRPEGFTQRRRGKGDAEEEREDGATPSPLPVTPDLIRGPAYFAEPKTARVTHKRRRSRRKADRESNLTNQHFCRPMGILN